MAKGVKGTRDFYPEEMRLRNWLFDNFTYASLLHGFEEYDAPVLETEELYTRKQGEDIVKQLYNFKDKGDRKVALRPEMTPSLARMVMSRAGVLPMPIKWFSIPSVGVMKECRREEVENTFNGMLTFGGLHLVF